MTPLDYNTPTTARDLHFCVHTSTPPRHTQITQTVRVWYTWSAVYLCPSEGVIIKRVYGRSIDGAFQPSSSINGYPNMGCGVSPPEGQYSSSGDSYDSQTDTHDVNSPVPEATDGCRTATATDQVPRTPPCVAKLRRKPLRRMLPTHEVSPFERRR